jgi:putative nucleotide binding protein
MIESIEWEKGMKGLEKKSRGEKGRVKERETYARVLDYLPYGYPDDPRPVYQKKPLVQAIGEDNFILMELTPKEDRMPVVYDLVYIGEGEREVIDHVNKKLRYNELTPTAKMGISYLLEKIINEKEGRFIRIYNEASSITPRLHMLDLLPGIGEKLKWTILEEREKRAFSNFEDLTKRVKGLYHPEKILAKRIEEELKEEHAKYRFFLHPL